MMVGILTLNVDLEDMAVSILVGMEGSRLMTYLNFDSSFYLDIVPR